MRNKQHLSSIHLSQGQKTAKSNFAKYSTLFFTTLLFFCTGLQAQTITVERNAKVTVSTQNYDDCGSILKISLSSFEDEYYFDFKILEDGKNLTSQDVSFEGEATVFRFNEHNNIAFNSGSYGSRPTTYYLNTRQGKPYILSSDAPSTNETFLKIDGKTTINAEEDINFKGVICPSDNYTYQWYENETAITGATSETLTYTPTSPTATYKLEVSKNGSVVKSATKSIITIGDKERFNISPWYGVGSYNIKEILGYCNNVYMVTIKFSENDPQFVLTDNGDVISTNDVTNNTSLTATTQRGDDGTLGWKITNRDIKGKEAIFFIDTRNGIKFTDELTKENFISANIFTSKGDNHIERGGKVSLGSEICSNTSVSATYQWQMSTDKGQTWSNISDATQSTLEDFAITTDSTYVRLSVNSGSLSCTSNSIIISFEPSDITINIPQSEKINQTEYEVPNYTPIEIYLDANSINDVTYSVKIKDFTSSTWKDTVLGSELPWVFEPNRSLVYRIQAQGTDVLTEEAVSVTRNIIIRIIHRCDANTVTDTLWHDDFGYFANATTYITKDVTGNEKTYTGTITDEDDNECKIERYMAADPNHFVKEHKFAALDPLFGPRTKEECDASNYKPYACWDGCNGTRVEDGYFAILSNPNISNCGRADRDYWDGSDHSGNENGGMLFVNCSNSSKGAIIYERELTLSNECSNVQLLFSAFISNAAIKTGQKPVNVRLDVLDENRTLVHSATSGDIMPRTTGQKWSNLTFRFKSTGQKKYIIQLTNNNDGGSEFFGNDILLDDITITICYPNVELITDMSDRAKDTIETCKLDTVVNLYAYNRNGIKTYIDEPVYLFQYKKENEVNAKWQDVEEGGEGLHFSDSDNIQIKLDKNDKRFVGTTKFRAIVGSSKDIISDIIDEENTSGNITMQVDCDHVYAIDSAFVIIFHYSGPMGADIDTAGCIRETMTIIGDASDKPEFKWVDADADTLISENQKELTFLIDGSKDDYHFYFIGTEKMGCADTQKVHVRKKENVWFDAPEEFVVCEFDSLVTLTNVVLKDSDKSPLFTWELNGVIDTEQIWSKFRIPSSAPLEGAIKVTGSAEGFCDSTRTIKYTIHKKYNLKLDTNVEDDRLCFGEHNNVITLTAKYNPETARPNKFYWYKSKDNGAMEYLDESSEPTFNIKITENGKYKFMVKSTDDICYKDKDAETTPTQTDTISASRSLDMILTTMPENAVICDGASIDVNLQIKNAIAEKEVTWSCDDFNGKTTTVDSLSKITITPVKSTKFTDKRVLTVSVVDDVCNQITSTVLNYEIHNNIELSIDDIPTFCLGDSSEITLNATVTEGEPVLYEWMEGTTTLATTNSNSAKVAIKEGSNNYSVIASDTVCASKTSAVMSTEARLPITIDIDPKDSVFCEGTTITFRATIKNALDETTVPVIWSGDDIANDSTIKGKDCKLTLTPLKSNKQTETRSISIKTNDDVCKAGEPIVASTNYTIHNKMDIAILAKRTDGLFCLTSGDNSDTIHLKVDVKAGEPTLYQWYKNDSKLGESTNTDTALAIGVGTNQYKVIANDGICSDVASVVVPIKARHKLGMDLNPKNANICEGESIKLTATLDDALGNDTKIFWKGDDIAEGSVTIGSPSSYTVKTRKSAKTMQTASATITATDDVCQRDTIVSVNYNVYMKVDLQLLSDIASGKICKKDQASSKTQMTILVKKGNPNKFIWNDGTTGTRNDTVRIIELAEGTNTFSVRATDDVCNKRDSSEATANNTIETREPIIVDLFLDKSLVCIGNKIKATADIRNSHSGSTSNIRWSDGATKDNVSNGQHSEWFTPSVGSQSINVTVSDANSNICPATVGTAVIAAQDSLRLTIAPNKSSLCQREDTTQYIKLTVGIKSGWPSRVIWSTGDTTKIDTSNTTHILVAPHANTTYWAYGTDDICKNSDKIYTNELKVTNKLDVNLNIEKPEVQMGEEIILSVETSNNEFEKISWYNTETGELLGETTEKEFRYQPNDDQYGVFKFGVVIDNNYCGNIESGNRKITVADYTLVPNIITPYNANGKNDVFMGPKDGKPGYKVEIYNRYQQMVFEGEDGWDGYYRGHLAEPGTYFFRVFMKDGRVYKGTLEVAKF